MLSSQPRSAPVAAAKAQIKKQLDWASQDLGAAAGTAGKGSAPTRPRCWLAHFLQWAQPAGADSMVQRDPGSCSISHAASAKSPERWSGGGGDSPHSRDWITSGPCVCDEPRSPSSPPLCYCTNHEPTPPSQLGGELRPLQPLSLLDLVLGAPAKLLPGRWCPLPWVHLISVTRIPVNLRPAWCLQQSRLHVPRLVMACHDHLRPSPRSCQSPAPRTPPSWLEPGRGSFGADQRTKKADQHLPGV
ncbi:uncharacterized protein LOC127040136 isoform X2 [Gopherus flavomarginatus]|uniref:uncharacterized protein LOC127040136 isoform X2 n=1 Tax=Gopherus flavomarginatus TaxID=286002 RepID=UPI0021CC0040|nr:uncharacterized protein LOC127040136 isoform X2 [Gopherus flavomarginatus]